MLTHHRAPRRVKISAPIVTHHRRSPASSAAEAAGVENAASGLNPQPSCPVTLERIIIGLSSAKVPPRLALRQKINVARSLARQRRRRLKEPERAINEADIKLRDAESRGDMAWRIFGACLIVSQVGAWPDIERKGKLIALGPTYAARRAARRERATA